MNIIVFGALHFAAQNIHSAQQRCAMSTLKERTRVALVRQSLEKAQVQLDAALAALPDEEDK